MAIRKSDLNFIVDAVAFGCFLFMVATGVIMEYLLPPGSGQQVSIWGLDRHAWGDIHFWLAVVLLTTLALHVYLHWRWIVCVLRRRPSEGSGVRMSLGITALLALLAIALAPLFSPVERNTAAPDRAGPRWTMSEDVEEITGSMTLGEAAIQTGVAAGSLLTALALRQRVEPGGCARGSRADQISVRCRPQLGTARRFAKHNQLRGASRRVRTRGGKQSSGRWRCGDPWLNDTGRCRRPDGCAVIAPNSATGIARRHTGERTAGPTGTPTRLHAG
jgi:hypothetical protein